MLIQADAHVSLQAEHRLHVILWELLEDDCCAIWAIITAADAGMEKDSSM